MSHNCNLSGKNILKVHEDAKIVTKYVEHINPVRHKDCIVT